MPGPVQLNPSPHAATAAPASVMHIPPKLSLRANSGAVTARVPPGRYDLDAESASGEEHVRGVRDTQESPFAITALSGSGDVTVEGAR